MSFYFRWERSFLKDFTARYYFGDGVKAHYLSRSFIDHIPGTVPLILVPNACLIGDL